MRALLDAYGDFLKRKIATTDDLPRTESDLLEHFRDSRLEFYSAESLRAFSRDAVPAGGVLSKAEDA
ncbi:MAG: hypothetical protein OXC95_08215, partial [Dehalococcoidia bacterium]|nr:hypothetical protein [Dehalococcoidia bacterium]